MKIKKLRNKIYLFSTILGVGIITSLVLGVVLPIQGQISSNENQIKINNDESTAILNNDRSARVITNSNFTLKNNDAINLQSSVGAASMIATTIGPRGFLTDNSSNIVYMGTNGQIIWQSNLIINNANNQTLLASYYNAASNSFILLYSHNSNRVSIISINETSGGTLSAYEYGTLEGLYSDLVMYEVQGVNNIYGIYSRHGSAYMENRRVVNVLLSSNGRITAERNYRFGNNHGEPWFFGLSAGAIRIGNDEYFFAMNIASQSDSPVQMLIYKNGQFQTWESFTNVNNGWIGSIFSSTNVPQVWLKEGRDGPNRIINFGFILNGNIESSYAHYNLNLVKGGYYSVSTNIIEQRSIDLRNTINWNIYNGRFYGDYFYGMLWNDNNQKLQMIKLHMNDQWDPTWNAQSFQVISEGNIFGSSRLTVYNLPIGMTNLYHRNYRYNIYALPIYSTTWNGKQDIMNFYSYNNISDRPNMATNLWILDESIPSLAYKTRLSSNTNEIRLNNVSNILVSEVSNGNLEEYIRPIFSQQFTQYQSGTSFRITKKNIPGNDFRGIIAASIQINDGYNNSSLTKSAVSFDIIFSGFKSFSTSINNSPELTNDLINILSQSVESGTNINSNLKNYIFRYVILDSSQLLTINDIALINVESFNNLTGTLILRSIGLNKWINSNGIIENSLKLFSGPIVINGFRKINATSLITNNLNIPQVDVTANDVTIANLRTILFDNRNSIFAVNSLPDAFISNNIINISKNNIDNVNGNLLVNFQLSTFYSNDRGTLTNNITPIFALLIDGFRFTDHGTIVVSPLTSINELNTYPYQIKQLNSINVLRHFILENVISKNKTGLTVDNIVSIELNNSDAYDNKNGVLYLDSITLNKWYEDDGSMSQPGQTRVFTIGNGLKITIQGFGRINGFTSIRPNISVTNELINIIPDIATNEQIINWISSNMNLVFNNLPINTTITGISNIVAQSSIGEIALDVAINQYFENDVNFTFQNVEQIYTRVILQGMKVNNYATFTSSPSTNVDKTVITELPQFINTSNNDFKTYLLNHVIQGKKDNIDINNIINFQVSNFNNLTGSLTLANITLNKWYDANGNVNNRIQQFENGVTINGFNSIITTQLNVNEIDSGMNNVLPSNVSINDMRRLIIDKKDEIFVSNSIPDNFMISNITSLNIVNVSNATGTLEVFFIINNWYETSQGRLENTNSTLFSLKLTNFWTLSEASNVVSSNILINENVLPYLVNATNYSVRLKEYLYSFVLQGNKTNLIPDNIVGIRLASNPYDNKNGTLKLQSILMDKYYDVNGALITTTTPFEIKPANNGEILVKGFLQVVSATSIISSAITIDETISTFNIIEVSESDLKTWVDTNYKNIFNQLPENAVVTNVVKVLSESNQAKGELVVSITLDQYFDNDELYTYRNQANAFKATLTGFESLIIEETNQAQPSGIPDWSWYLIYGGAGLLGLLLLIWIITSISKRKKRSNSDYDDYF